MSIEGWARKKPLTPPLINIEIKPSENSDALLIRNFEPYKLPSQIRTTIVEGIVMISAYHRPTKLEEAIELLTQPDTVALGGGTHINTPEFRKMHGLADALYMSEALALIGAGVMIAAAQTRSAEPSAVKI